MMRIAVTGVGGGVGQAVLRALQCSALEPDVIGLDVAPASAGLYTCSKGFRLPHANHVDYASRLLEVLAAEEVDALIPGSDQELPVLAALQSRLAEAGVRTVVGSPEAVAVCRDKLHTFHFFREAGLPFVQTVPAAQACALVEAVGFPLLVKPAGGSASRGASVVFDERELSQVVRQTGWIVQPYLAPISLGKARAALTQDDVLWAGVLRQEEEFSVQIVFDHEGHTLGRFTSCNVLKSGIPMFVDPRQGDPVESVALEMASRLADVGLMGPCNLQFKITEDGPLCFEVNPRFTGITGVRAAMGFNEVDAVLRRLVLDEPLERVRRSLRCTGDWVSMRFVDELLVPRALLSTLQNTGQVAAKSGGAPENAP